VVVSGRIRITKALGGEERVLAELEAGEFFGEMAILNHEPRNATACATEPTVLLVYDKNTFEQMLLGNPNVAVRMVHKLAERLRRTNEMIH
jgi:CRP-like cAMP-binding protein